MSDLVTTRETILAAAKARILHYGYAKTTMAEIARDCGMSAGNIYRFFDGKIDIAEALARMVHAQMDRKLEKIALDASLPAPERFRKLFRARMESSFSLMEMDSKVLEIAEVLDRERPLYMNEELARERVHIVRILTDGVADGAFRPIEDPAYTAEMIQSALMKFVYPQMFSQLTLEKLHRELEGVTDLLLQALEAG